MKKLISILLAFAMIFSFAACSQNETNTDNQTQTQAQTETNTEEVGFSEQSKQAVADFVAMYGKDSESYNGNAYVVCDFDNTTAVFDITYQAIIYQLEHMAFALKPDELKEAVSTELDMKADDNADWVADVSAAYNQLWDSYGPFTPAGVDDETMKTIQADAWWKEFSTKMRAFLYHVEDTTPEEINYSWILYWFSEMKPEEVYDLFYRSCAENEKVETQLVKWTSPEEIESKLGVIDCEFPCGVSITEDVKNMYKSFCEGGIDVWVCSASHLDGVRAAVDAFGISDYITGVIGMTQTLENGVYASSYDYKTGYPCDNLGNGKWQKSKYAIKTLPGLEGKVIAIENALVPLYGCGPLAGFMDSSGDFNFCTEFDSLKLVICYNRANRKITEGAGLIAVLAVYQKDTLGYNLKKANAAGDTYYVLQGRNENGLRTMLPSNETIRLGETQAKLFVNEDNEALLKYAIDNSLTTADFLNTFAIATQADSPQNKLGLAFGHLENYRGYHSVETADSQLDAA